MKKKLEIITFKVDEDLGKMIKDLPNRSQFIRTAIVNALGSTCPLCNGTGILSPNQKRHWDDFSTDHPFENCVYCNEPVLVCANVKG